MFIIYKNKYVKLLTFAILNMVSQIVEKPQSRCNSNHEKKLFIPDFRNSIYCLCVTVVSVSYVINNFHAIAIVLVKK